MVTFTAQSDSDLIAQLDAIRQPVPPLGAGRTKEHTEAWSRHSLLASIAGRGYLRFPLRVTSSDRPDLELTMPRHKVGVEITELVPPNYARAFVVRDREFPSAVLDPSLFGWDDPSMSGAEIRQLLRRTGHALTGPGWAGDEPEREWARAVQATINVKTQKLNQPGYAAYPSYWLVIYKNLPLPAVNVKRAVEHLRAGLNIRSSAPRSFSHVFIESYRTMVCITRSGRVRYLHAVTPHPI